MNSRKSKLIRKRAKEYMLEWYLSLLPEEEKSKITLDNILDKAPQQKYTIALGTRKLSMFSYRWFIKTLKKGLDPRSFHRMSYSEIGEKEIV